MLQLLMGHGTFGDYLLHREKTNTDACPLCGEPDYPLHAILECPGVAKELAALDDTLTQLKADRPWNLNSLVRDKDAYGALMTTWTALFERRDL